MRKYWVLIFILISALIIVYAWFGDKLLMGVGESGLSFYNLQRNEFLSRYAWVEWGFGNYNGTLTATWPTFWLLGLLEKIGLLNYQIQALVFYFILTSSGISIYCLCRLLFSKVSNLSILAGVFFYWFNPLVLINTWHRFLLDFTFFYALLPLALYLFLRGLEKKNYVYVVYFGLVSIIFSFAFAAWASVILMWGVLFLVTIIHVLIFNRKDKLFSIKFFVLSLGFFSLVHSWWLSQLIYLVYSKDLGRAVNMYATAGGNLDSLISVSNQLGSLSYIFRFLHGGYFVDAEAWTKVFSQPVFVGVELIVTALIIAGIILNRRKKYILLMAIFLFVGMFLMKGVAVPFGELFGYLFVKLKPLQLFRNPFEKFSLLVVISSTLIFVFTIHRFTIFTKKIYLRRLLYSFVFMVLILFWGYPLLSNKVFTYSEVWDRKVRTSYNVAVPDYYKKASEWLNGQLGNFRFIALPLGNEGITYSWEHSYRGVELSYLLLNTPGISNSTTIPYYGLIAEGLEKAFFNIPNFTKVANAINAKYILLRKDVNWMIERMRNPDVIEERLQQSQLQFTKEAEFGEISLWKNNFWEEKFIYPANKFVSSLPYSNVFDLIFTDQENVILTDPSLEDNVIIRPSYSFLFSKNLNSSFDMDPTIFPNANTLPTAFKYAFTILKEKFTLAFELEQVKRAEIQIALLGKRLVEAKLSKERGYVEGVNIALSHYVDQLKSFEETQQALSFQGGNVIAWRQEGLANVFSKHESVLQELFSLTDKSKDVYNDLHDMQKRLKIIPQRDNIENEEFLVSRRNVYQSDLPFAGEYSLYLETQGWNKYYKDKLKFVQVDNTLYSPETDYNQDGFTEIGKLSLEKGLHEFGINTPERVNLVVASEELNLKVDHGKKEVRYEIRDFDPYSDYEVSFDYFIRMGTGLTVSLASDNDPEHEGKKIPFFSKSISPDPYFFDQQSFGMGVKPSPDSTRSALVISVETGNNCEEIFWSSGRDKCDNTEFRSRYDQTTEVVIKNIVVKKVFDVVPILKFSGKSSVEERLPEVLYRKISPVLYEVDINNATDNFMLVMSQLFNTGWEIKYMDGQVVEDENHFLVNGYANGWMLEKKGDYEIVIEYKPQKYLDIGKKISAIAVSIGVVLVLVGIIRKRNEN